MDGFMAMTLDAKISGKWIV